MGYQLYGRRGYGSAVVEAALAEAGLACDFVEVPVGGDGAEFGGGFLALNPRGQVPVLVLPDGSVMAESAAMLLHLADAHPGAGLAPVPGSAARAQHDRWLLFMATNIYEGILRMFYSGRYVSDAGAAEAVRVAATEYVRRHFELLEAAVAGPYLFGDGLCMADLYIWMLAGWLPPEMLADCPKVLGVRAAVAARPVLAQVVADNPA